MVAEPRGTPAPDVVVQLAGDYLWNPGTNGSVESDERAATALTRRLRQMSTRLDHGCWATTSGVETLQPGVHRVPLALPNDGLRPVTLHLLEDLTDSDDLVMIDGGWAIPEAGKALEDALEAIGRDLGDLTHILVTHIHRDHYTQAVESRRLLGLPRPPGYGRTPGPGAAPPAARRRTRRSARHVAQGGGR